MVAARIGRSGALRAKLAAAPDERGHHRQIADLVLAGDAAIAADRLGEMTYWLTEADTLLAAKQFIEQGRDEEAEVQLKKALAFYRSVGATCFVGEAEALLSAASRGTRYRIGTDLNYR